MVVRKQIINFFHPHKKKIVCPANFAFCYDLFLTKSYIDNLVRPSFPLFQSHLDLAKQYWRSHLLTLQEAPVIVDATCGNGHDSLALVQMSPHLERLYCLDIQPQALEKTFSLLSSHVCEKTMEKIYLLQTSHETLPQDTYHLVVYNLGYLPGSDKRITTSTSSTLASLKGALSLLRAGGLISITCYPGHREGALEQEALLAYTTTLSPQEFLVCHHTLPNRNHAPSLLLLFKKN